MLNSTLTNETKSFTRLVIWILAFDVLNTFPLPICCDVVLSKYPEAMYELEKAGTNSLNYRVAKSLHSVFFYVGALVGLARSQVLESRRKGYLFLIAWRKGV